MPPRPSSRSTWYCSWFRSSGGTSAVGVKLDGAVGGEISAHGGRRHLGIGVDRLRRAAAGGAQALEKRAARQRETRLRQTVQASRCSATSAAAAASSAPRLKHGARPVSGARRAACFIGRGSVRQGGDCRKGTARARRRNTRGYISWQSTSRRVMIQLYFRSGLGRPRDEASAA